MKRFFLIDMENVGKRSVMVKDGKVLKSLTEEDVIVVFSNDAHPNGCVSLDFLRAIAETKATYRMVQINCDGKNALDFALASMLGMLIHENGSHAEYWIVSNDMGFEACRKFAEGFNVRVGITPSIDTRECREEREAARKEMLKSLLPELSRKAICLTYKCLEVAKSKEDYHNRLQKVLYESQLREVYGRTKHLLETKV